MPSSRLFTRWRLAATGLQLARLDHFTDPFNHIAQPQDPNDLFASLNEQGLPPVDDELVYRFVKGGILTD